jgi:hypothetical protein
MDSHLLIGQQSPKLKSAGSDATGWERVFCLASSNRAWFRRRRLLQEAIDGQPQL